MCRCSLHQRLEALAFVALARQEASPGGGREGHGDLKLRVVMPPCPLPGMAPVVIEDVLALAECPLA